MNEEEMKRSPSDDRVLRGHIVVLGRRLNSLKGAIERQNLANIAFVFDQCLRAQQKLEELVPVRDESRAGNPVTTVHTAADGSTHPGEFAGCQDCHTSDAAIEEADEEEARRTGGTFALRYLGLAERRVISQLDADKPFIVLNPALQIVDRFATEREAAGFLDSIGQTDETVAKGEWSIDNMVNPDAPPYRVEVCECIHACADDPATACSLSGEFHTHPGEPCPVHPDAPCTS